MRAETYPVVFFFVFGVARNASREGRKNVTFSLSFPSTSSSVAKNRVTTGYESVASAPVLWKCPLD